MSTPTDKLSLLLFEPDGHPRIRWHLLIAFGLVLFSVQWIGLSFWSGTRPASLPKFSFVSMVWIPAFALTLWNVCLSHDQELARYRGETLQGFHFSLRTMLIIPISICFWLSATVYEVSLAGRSHPQVEDIIGTGRAWFHNHSNQLNIEVTNPTFDDKDFERLLAVIGRSSDSPVPRDVSLAGTNITDESLYLMAEWKSVRNLSLNGTSISDEGLKSLSALSNLRLICLDDTNVTPKARTELLEAIPGLRMVTQK